MRTELVIDAFTMAAGQRSTEGLVFHSDRGSQYTSKLYQETLEGAGVTSSMSRRGNCWDKAVSESFFSTLKTELIYRPAMGDAERSHLGCPRVHRMFLQPQSPPLIPGQCQPSRV